MYVEPIRSRSSRLLTIRRSWALWLTVCLFQGLMLVSGWGEAKANAPMELEQIMTQIHEMRQHYDRRIARLEQQRLEDQKRIQALEFVLPTLQLVRSR